MDRPIRALLLGGAVFAEAATLAAFVVAPTIGAAYLVMVSAFGSALPALTRDVLLPLLRTTGHVAAWAWPIWLLLLALPLLSISWTARPGADEARAALRALAAGYAWVALVVLLAVVCLAGAVLPLTPLARPL